LTTLEMQMETMITLTRKKMYRLQNLASGEGKGG
jgi:hypothetical protein